MNFYNLLPVSFLLLVCQLALGSHNIDFYCQQTRGKTCESRIEKALLKIGCELEEESIECSSTKLTNDKVKCKVANVSNCEEPSPYLFSMTANGTYCANGKKKALYWHDWKLSLTWSMGMIRSYVKHICVNQ